MFLQFKTPELRLSAPSTYRWGLPVRRRFWTRSMIQWSMKRRASRDADGGWVDLEDGEKMVMLSGFHRNLHGWCGISFWLVVWLPFFIFPYIGNNHPNWRTHIFQSGGPTTNQHWIPWSSLNIRWIFSRQIVQKSWAFHEKMSVCRREISLGMGWFSTFGPRGLVSMSRYGSHHPTIYWGCNFQQIWEGDVQNKFKTNPPTIGTSIPTPVSFLS